MLDEYTQGEWLDSSLYQCLDSGQNATIDFLISKKRFLASQGQVFEPETLTPLIVLDASGSTTSGTIEYPLPSDYIETYHVDYDTNGNSALRPTAKVSFHEAQKRKNNTFYNDIENPFYYIRESKIGLLPAPSTSTSNAYKHYYYKQPSTVTVSQNFSIRSDSHDAIIMYAAFMAFTKDQNPVADSFFAKWAQAVQNL